MGWFSHENYLVWRDALLRRADLSSRVVPGTTFQRIHADALIETARVLSVSRDSYGIPHVKFQVSFRRPNRSTFDEANRMLALKAFADRYKEMAPA